jgi:hypothetical protein
MSEFDRLRVELRNCTEDIERLLNSAAYARMLGGNGAGRGTAVAVGATSAETEAVRAEQERIGRRIAHIRAEMQRVSGTGVPSGATPPAPASSGAASASSAQARSSDT